MSNADEEFQSLRAAMELNLKRAVTPMLILRMIAASETTVAEAQAAIASASNGLVLIENLYPSIYRFLDNGYIEKVGIKGLHPIGRHAEVFRITEKGTSALVEYEHIYERYTYVVDKISL